MFREQAIPFESKHDPCTRRRLPIGGCAIRRCAIRRCAIGRASRGSMCGRWAAMISAWACLFALSPFAESQAETTNIGSLPGRPGAVGFVLSVEVEPISGNGYQPVYLNFLPLRKKFGRDRNLEVAIEPRNWARTELDYEYRHPITIPQGAGKTQVPVYLPVYFPWDNIRFELYEDGKKVDRSEVTLGLPGLRYSDADQNTAVGILVENENAPPTEPWQRCPDVRTLVTVLGEGPLPSNEEVKRLDHKAARKRVGSVQPAWVQFRPFDITRMHRQWLGYSQLDVIMVAAPVLEKIERMRPDEFETLLSWVAAGGNLWVYASERATNSSFLGQLETPELTTLGSAFLTTLNGKPNLQGDNDDSELIKEGWGTSIHASQSYARRSEFTLEPRSDVYKRLQKAKHPFAARGDLKKVLAGVGDDEPGNGPRHDHTG